VCVYVCVYVCVCVLQMGQKCSACMEGCLELLDDDDPLPADFFHPVPARAPMAAGFVAQAPHVHVAFAAPQQHGAPPTTASGISGISRSVSASRTLPQRHVPRHGRPAAALAALMTVRARHPPPLLLKKEVAAAANVLFCDAKVGVGHLPAGAHGALGGGVGAMDDGVGSLAHCVISNGVARVTTIPNERGRTLKQIISALEALSPPFRPVLPRPAPSPNESFPHEPMALSLMDQRAALYHVLMTCLLDTAHGRSVRLTPSAYPPARAVCIYLLVYMCCCRM
jgi:hypothetical protein